MQQEWQLAFSGRWSLWSPWVLSGGHSTAQRGRCISRISLNHRLFTDSVPAFRPSLNAVIMTIRSYANVAELADAPDLGSGGATRGGSSPSIRTSESAVSIEP